ncbi:beta-L-arabinofuranosidase domain-containing protein [Sphingomonas sp. PP-CC-3G-468]|uniref:beta-L-arabinofuranosidase domain-containing protein n=1 Tax=Sphingomonas sp. PP-CC-3G-468 TaxID=2135656 RepID=UPI001046F557|nr:beta-L-arabinofuranosidase domain-containing protein [Sphingomonas sp. PP-CC-3G-468]TCM07418.1 hypothetical protein C8J41_103326 [Sphingomonas sp. PP-CC-3G-468]
MMNRRSILRTAGAATVSGILPGTIARADASSAARLDELDYADVTLLDGLAKRQATQTLDALLAMDDDMLLRPFRVAARLAATPSGLGGWYDANPAFAPPVNLTGYIPGHSFGQYVSALSRAYAVTGDVRARAKVDRLIAGFAPTISPAFYDDYPIPAYTFDKIVVGLVDAHAFADNRQALSLLDAATDAVLPRLPGRALDRSETEPNARPNMAFGWDETYTLSENLYRAAELGAGERYHRMARQYLLERTYLDPLAAGRNVLAGRHAYSHVNALASAMKAYIVDGDAKHLASARNGMNFVLDQSFATGGWGPDEAFVEPGSAKLGESLGTTHRSFEAPCGTFGHFKVARYLLRVTADSRWGDSMERLFYNAALGILPLQPNGAAFYYADYNEIGAKGYYEYACPCCSGSIGQLTADYGINAYLRDARGLFVNLYTPSRAIWRQRGEPVLTLTQNGDYPLGDHIAFSIAVPRTVSAALRFRIPAWAGPMTMLSVNGQPVARPIPGRFASIERRWHDGDRVDLMMDRPLRAEAIDRHFTDRVAMVHGPLALFATGDRFTPLTRKQVMTLRQTSSGTATWTLDGGTGIQSFRPWFALAGGEATRLYQRIINDV